MKKVVLLVSVLFFATACNDATSRIESSNEVSSEESMMEALPTIDFESDFHDFGEIQNGTPVETVFTYTNSGQSPLVVTDIKSTCGCTVPQGWSREPLAPGASSQFTVKFNGKGANKVSKTITLTTNTESGREQVRISAFIVPDPNAAPVVKTQ